VKNLWETRGFFVFAQLAFKVASVTHGDPKCSAKSGVCANPWANFWSAPKMHRKVGPVVQTCVQTLERRIRDTLSYFRRFPLLIAEIAGGAGKTAMAASCSSILTWLWAEMRVMAAHLVRRPAVCQMIHYNLRQANSRHARQPGRLTHQFLDVILRYGCHRMLQSNLSNNHSITGSTGLKLAPEHANAVSSDRRPPYLNRERQMCRIVRLLLGTARIGRTFCHSYMPAK
jgi:hypothetical protein